VGGAVDDSWSIVHPNADGSFDRLPNAAYDIYANDHEPNENMMPVDVTEYYIRWDRGGCTKNRTAIYADGKFVAGAGDS
jgi:hypothetical protein